VTVSPSQSPAGLDGAVRSDTVLQSSVRQAVPRSGLQQTNYV